MQKSSEPYTAFGVGFPETLIFSSSLLLLSWDSYSPIRSPDKGHQLHCHYGSHSGVGTIGDAGQTDLHQKLPSVWGRRNGKVICSEWDGTERLFVTPTESISHQGKCQARDILILLIHQSKEENEKSTSYFPWVFLFSLKGYHMPCCLVVGGLFSFASTIWVKGHLV